MQLLVQRWKVEEKGTQSKFQADGIGSVMHSYLDVLVCRYTSLVSFLESKKIKQTRMNYNKSFA